MGYGFELFSHLAKCTFDVALEKMGVPTFLRFIHDRFPRCIRDYTEVQPDGLEAACAADWSAEPNPNGLEIDNLYLDFNGLVHSATHPSDRPAPPDDGARMLEVFRQLDRVVLAARPRKLVYLALDGVAPRAKMNQQRVRRFMAARGREEEALHQARLVATWRGEAGAKEHEMFDHNAITPGTEFMRLLGESLRYYCAARVAHCEAWRKLTIVLSDASVPGEGEHKIMQHIRQQRLQPGYAPDTTHCVYGLDADLVMLALATHEPRFYILRDFVPIGRQRFIQVCDVCGKVGHLATECDVFLAAKVRDVVSFCAGPSCMRGVHIMALLQAHADEGQKAAAAALTKAYKPLQLLDVAVLREYLLHLLRPEAFIPPPAARRGAASDGGAAG